MILALAAWIAAILYKIKKVYPRFNPDFLNRDTTTCINGIFILLVFMSHFNQYARYTAISDIWYARMIGKVGQFMVTTFLFYSGYGIMESIKEKGKGYINKIPKKRIFGTLFKFFLAVNIFALMAHYHIPLKRLLLSFIAWSSIGNSNWYIFAILMCYLFTFVSFSVFYREEDYKIGCAGVFLLSLVYVVVMYKLRKLNCWYDTILCYSAGMFVSLYKEKVINLFQNRIKTIGILVGGIGFYFIVKNLLLHYHMFSKREFLMFINIFYVLAVLLVVFITTNVRVGNDILKWFGSHLFSFYILQRLPMIYLKKAGLDKNIYLYFLICFIISCILAGAFKKLTDYLDVKMGL